EGYPELRFEVADIREFEAEAPFDAIFSNATLHWVRPPEQAAARIYAALCPGGRFVAEFGGKGNVEAITSATLAALQAAGFPPGPDALNYYPSLGEYATLLEAAGFRVTYAVHFDRPTPLEGGESGLRNWLGMFGGRFLAAAPDDQREAVVAEIEERLRGRLWRDEQWWADYVRLRVVASKPDVEAAP
ncbi:MAG TPA: methyltransferase domain-containing protein, partial [Armatimonadota bacterium]|nr:methyltransferase domain-containing protein [Armatimonadota bacterium]